MYLGEFGKLLHAVVGLTRAVQFRTEYPSEEVELGSVEARVPQEYVQVLQAHIEANPGRSEEATSGGDRRSPVQGLPSPPRIDSANLRTKLPINDALRQLLEHECKEAIRATEQIADQEFGDQEQKQATRKALAAILWKTSEAYEVAQVEDWLVVMQHEQEELAQYPPHPAAELCQDLQREIPRSYLVADLVDELSHLNAMGERFVQRGAPSPEQPRLTTLEQRIMDVLGQETAGQGLTSGQVHQALQSQGKICNEESVKKYLGVLANRGLLVSPGRGSRNGYRLARER